VFGAATWSGFCEDSFLLAESTLVSQKYDRPIGNVVIEFFSLLPPSGCLHSVCGFLTSKICWKCMYGTPIQPVETVEHLIFNHPIDDIPSIGKGGNLLQATWVCNVWWIVIWRKLVVIGHVHNLKCKKADQYM
jgi:hypothetical protein